MGEQCAGFTRHGQRRTRTVSGTLNHCWLRDPAHAPERSRYRYLVVLQRIAFEGFAADLLE